MGKLMEDKSYFNKGCYVDSSWCHCRTGKELSPAIMGLRVVLLGPPLPATGEGDTFTNGNLWSAFRQIGSGRRDLFFFWCLLVF